MLPPHPQGMFFSLIRFVYVLAHPNPGIPTGRMDDFMTSSSLLGLSWGNRTMSPITFGLPVEGTNSPLSTSAP